jgi:hypothetical protein
VSVVRGASLEEKMGRQIRRILGPYCASKSNGREQQEYGLELSERHLTLRFRLLTKRQEYQLQRMAHGTVRLLQNELLIRIQKLRAMPVEQVQKMP